MHTVCKPAQCCCRSPSRSRSRGARGEVGQSDSEAPQSRAPHQVRIQEHPACYPTAARSAAQHNCRRLATRRCVWWRPSVGHWEQQVPCCASFAGQHEGQRMCWQPSVIACRLTAASLQVQALDSPLLGGTGEMALEPGQAGASGGPHHSRALVTEGSGSSTPRRLGSTLAQLFFSGKAAGRLILPHMAIQYCWQQGATLAQLS